MATKNTNTKKVSNAERLVSVTIPRDGKKGPVYVSVNNRTYLIQRGKTVTVPHFVAEQIKHQEKMLDVAEAYNDSVTRG